MAFGNTLGFQDIHYYGPLERTIRLEREGSFDVRLGEPVGDASAFERARVEVDGYRLETPSGGVDPVLRIVRDGETVHEIERDSTSGFDHRSFTFSRDGRYVVSGGGGGVLTVYERESGDKVHDLVGHTAEVWAVAVSPDDRLVVSGSADQTVRLWNLRTGALLVSIFVGRDDGWVAWTPQGYYTAGGGGERYVGWHVNRGVDRQAAFYGVGQFRERFHRPDVVNRTLELGDAERAASEVR